MIRRKAAALAISAVAPLLATSASVAHAAATPAPSAHDTLTWHTCTESHLPSDATCATLVVPRDWSAPDGKSYSIAVARIPARSGASNGVLTFNPGGPGSSGLDSLHFVESVLPKEVRDTFDLVAFDPRGVGASEPHLADCFIPGADLPDTGSIDWSTSTESAFAATSAANEQCLTRNAADAPYIGTWQVIRDVDALRKAMGQQQLTLWGMSYGTTLGRAYAQAFPQRVRALILDGTITPTPSIGGYAREHIWDDITAVRTMLGGYGAPLQRSYRKVMRFLDKHTLAGPKGSTITRWDVANSVIGRVAYQSRWPEIRDLLNSLSRAIGSRHSSAAMRRAAALLARPADDVPARAAGDSGRGDPAYTFINCVDMPDRPTAAALALVAEQGAKVGGTVYGAPALDEGLQCAGLPAFGTPVPALTAPLRLATPPIVINSIGDNRTPWLGARATANLFTGSRMITYAGTQHVSYGLVSSCITDPATNYLLTRELPARSIACPLVVPAD